MSLSSLVMRFFNPRRTFFEPNLDDDIHGINAAISTPFKTDGSINVEYLKQHVRDLILNGNVTGIAYMGNFGEGQRVIMDDENLEAGLQAIIEVKEELKAKGYDFRLIAGVVQGSEDLIRGRLALFSKEGYGKHIDAYLVSPPLEQPEGYSNERFMEFLAEQLAIGRIDKNLIVYRTPLLTAVTKDIDHRWAEKFLKLIDNAGLKIDDKPISVTIKDSLAIKDTGANVAQLYNQVHADSPYRNRIRVVHGDDKDILLSISALKAADYKHQTGGISGPVNILPVAVMEGLMHRAYAEGLIDLAADIQDYLSSNIFPRKKQIAGRYYEKTDEKVFYKALLSLYYPGYPIHIRTKVGEIDHVNVFREEDYTELAKFKREIDQMGAYFALRFAAESNSSNILSRNAAKAILHIYRPAELIQSR